MLTGPRLCAPCTEAGACMSVLGDNVAAGGPSGARSEGVRVASVLMAVAALAAGLSAVSAVAGLSSAGAGTALVEAWRAYGLVVFAGLFALLAWRPSAYPGVWELVIFHKLALTATAFLEPFEASAADRSTILVWDGVLSVLLLTAYVGCRGWRAWRR